jgi:pyruvate formate lyase activating enzyme
VSDIVHLDETVAATSQAAVDIAKGALSLGMRDVTFDLDSGEFIRITGYLVRRSRPRARRDAAWRGTEHRARRGLGGATAHSITAEPKRVIGAMSSIRGLLADVVPSSCVDGPGNRFVVFLQGCNFDCLACHNPHTIRGARRGHQARGCPSSWTRSVRAAPFLSGVTVSGGEATVQWQFVLALFSALAADAELSRLSRLVDSNGQAGPAVWTALAPVVDGVMVDLKAFDRDVHAFLTSRSNERVMASIEQLAGLGRLAEVRLLVIPGVNDREDHLAATADWLTSLGPDVPVRLLAFRHEGTRDVAEPFDEAGPEALDAARRVLVDHGLHPDSVAVGPT